MGCCGGDDDDEDRRLGPDTIPKRQCTDLLFTLIFAVFVIGMAAVCGWGVENGEPERLLAGHDSYGNICGEDNRARIGNVNSGLDMTNYKYAYFTLSEDTGYRRLCVAECPGAYTIDTTTIENLGLCLGRSPSAYVAAAANATSEARESCPTFAYSSYFTGVTSWCVPQLNDTLTRAATEEFNGAVEVEQAMSDVYASLDVIGWMSVVAIVGVFSFISFMRCCASPIVWSAVILCFVGLCCATGAFIYSTVDAKKDLDDKSEEEQTKVEQANLSLLVFGTIFFSVLLLVYTCIVCAMRKRIAQAIDIFEEAAVALFSMPTTFCCPFIVAFFMVLWIAACITIIMYVVTANDYNQDEYGYIEYAYTEDQRFLLWYMIFAIFWGSQLLLAMLEFTIAGNMSQWYIHDENPPGWPLKTSIFWILRYHIGSLIFGALIVAIIQMVRVILEFIEHQAKKQEMGDTMACLRKWIFNCIRCCLYCLEKCVKFINKNAYIQIAIWGSSFCPSCWNVVGLLRKHIGLISAVNGVAYLIVFIIKLGVCVGTAFLAYLWVETKSDIEFYSLIVTIVFLLSFMLVDAFTDVYEVAAEAIMILVLEDHDKNSPGPFLMSERMGSFQAKMGSQKMGSTSDGKVHREGRQSKTTVNPAGPSENASAV